VADAAVVPQLADGQRVFAWVLDREWQKLLEETEALRQPACHPAKALLKILTSLPVIGGEER
jgi:hypothetical protein